MSTRTPREFLGLLDRGFTLATQPKAWPQVRTKYGYWCRMQGVTATADLKTEEVVLTARVLQVLKCKAAGWHLAEGAV